MLDKFLGQNYVQFGSRDLQETILAYITQYYVVCGILDVTYNANQSVEVRAFRIG